ncbi:MAG: carboxypeptidase-like regulatory domain-containing protein [Ignavibacteriales bacterium]|nr:carboxypeptidase-like regulatory domain-containing protein [Ignavibacteriales bacterium]
MFRLLLILTIAASFILPQKKEHALHGKVYDKISGLPVPGCTVYIKSQRTGAITDSSGAFLFYLSAGEYLLSLSHISYNAAEKLLWIPLRVEDMPLAIKLTPATIQQKEVNVTINRSEYANIQEIQAKDLIKVPTVFNDVLRSVTILSGVVTNNELSSAYNVRGGNYSENLIYLNGYEVYRPFLLKHVVEENQTFINPDMVEKLEFFNGSFPVTYGDKMSSALSVNYRKEQKDEFSGKARANFLNAGVTLGRRFGNLTILGGLRFAYPGYLVSQLQTSGKYHPSFADIQLFSSCKISGTSEIELFVVQGKNTFNTSPVNWTGNFRDDHGPGLASAVDIRYEGNRGYSFSTGLYAGRFKKSLGGDASISVSYAHYTSKEDETGNISGMYFYIPDAAHPDENVEYLKSRFESSDNHLHLKQEAIDITWLKEYPLHSLTAGISGKWKKVSDTVNESALDTGASNLVDNAVFRKDDRTFYPDEFSLFLIDTYKPAINWEFNAGARVTYAKITGELLLSPRLHATWIINMSNKFFAGWGYYYQPPYYLESRLNKVPLKSQLAVHYSLGWENKFKPNVSFRLEGYYKALDKLIPYYTEGQKIFYTGTNSKEGYAYGADAMFQGEIVEGIQSWLGYGYLSTQEHPKSGGSYQRRLTDQTHSLLFFLQDRIKKHRNWQVHTRLQAGTGQLYYNRSIAYDELSKKYVMSVDMNGPSEHFLYMRADMGCSVEYEVYKKQKLHITAEVLNVFNTYNYAGFQFVQVFINIPRPVRIPEVLSSRFFNVQLEYEL